MKNDVDTSQCPLNQLLISDVASYQFKILEVEKCADIVYITS